jgi:hypothetical protein
MFVRKISNNRRIPEEKGETSPRVQSIFKIFSVRMLIAPLVCYNVIRGGGQAFTGPPSVGLCCWGGKGFWGE